MLNKIEQKQYEDCKNRIGGITEYICECYRKNKNARKLGRVVAVDYLLSLLSEIQYELDKIKSVRDANLFTR